MPDTDTPRPTTAIPELAAMPLRDDEFACVIAASNAIDALLVQMLRRVAHHCDAGSNWRRPCWSAPLIMATPPPSRPGRSTPSPRWGSSSTWSSAWARSIYLAAAIGTAVLTNRPLRDALRFHPGKTHFDHMMGEGRRIAAAAGIPISKSLTWHYQHALILDGSSVDAPPRVTDPGGAGREANFLLRQMTEHAESLGVTANSLRIALDAVADARGPRSMRRDVPHSVKHPIEV